MAVRVPGERADRHAGLHAEPRKRLGEPLHAAMRLCVIVAEEIALELARNDLGFAVVLRRVLDEPGHEQRQVHHQAAHQFPL
jgi:hypothetical protein